MKNSLGSEALVRRRLRRSAEVLLDDSSLRSNLTDGQSQQLLDWAFERVKEAAAATVDLGDAEAYPVLEEKVAVIRRVLRLVSRLMAEPGATPSEDQPDYLSRLAESLQQLAGQPNSPAQVTQATFLNDSRAQLDADTTFQLLVELIQPVRSQANDEEE